jgi:hypothetical protein
MADEFKYLPITANPLPSRRAQPQSVPVPNTSGYPNDVANTQTTRIRGTKLATKGNKFNSKAC